MSECVALFDFGASRIKSALCDLATGEFTDFRELPGGAFKFGPAAEPDYFTACFKHHMAGHLRQTGTAISSIWIASEMHGFLLAGEDGPALTPYYSWRYEHGGAAAYEAFVERFGETFRAITGMKPRRGLPVVNLVAMAADRSLPEGALVLGLPDWIAQSCGVWHRRSHPTLAAGTGLLDFAAMDWHPEYLSAIGGGLLCPVVSTDLSAPIGAFRHEGREIPIHGGIGDLQAALAALDLTPSELSINIGTGSQVSRVSPGRQDPLQAEVRPFFNDTILITQTHIPSGRALEVFSGLIDDIAAATGGAKGHFWRLVKTLSAGEIEAATLGVDMNVFANAWRFESGGSISGILEGQFSLAHLCAAITKGWLRQYETASHLVDPTGKTDRFVLSGGLGKRIPATADVLAGWLGRTYAAKEVADEETLQGLFNLARKSL